MSCLEQLAIIMHWLSSQNRVKNLRLPEWQVNLKTGYGQPLICFGRSLLRGAERLPTHRFSSIVCKSTSYLSPCKGFLTMSNGVQLDQEQLSAVEATERAIAILAGPGSGKTRVLSYRARYLLTSDAGSQALLLTFTNKAAAEMKARALAAANVSSSRIHAHTYHSLCQRILRSHGSLVGIDTNFEVMDDQEQQDFAT